MENFLKFWDGMRKAKNAGTIPNFLAHRMVFCFNLICHLFGFYNLWFLWNIFRAITAGQNTIITMLLIAFSWRAIEKKNDLDAAAARTEPWRWARSGFIVLRCHAPFMVNTRFIAGFAAKKFFIQFNDATKQRGFIGTGFHHGENRMTHFPFGGLRDTQASSQKNRGYAL